MKKLILAAILAATSVSALADDGASYVCDGQVVNFVDNTKGSVILDAATIYAKNPNWVMVLHGGPKGDVRSVFPMRVLTSNKAHVKSPGYVHWEEPNTTIDFVPDFPSDSVQVYLTDTTGSGDQLQLACHAPN